MEKINAAGMRDSEFIAVAGRAVVQSTCMEETVGKVKDVAV
jgi:hypothetical protein